MDNELFDLCKQVYEKTGWNENLQMYEYGSRLPLCGVPVYTSDYLLEKLPTPLYINKAPHQLQLIKAGDDFVAQYWFNDDNEPFYEAGKTALKALLRLTLELPEAGEK